MENMDAVNLVTNEDLEVWLSFGFVLHGSMASFVELRKMIENYLEEKPGEKYVFGTTNRETLFLIKSSENDLLKEEKEKY